MPGKPVTARTPGGGTRRLNTDEDKQEQAVLFERHRRVAKRIIDEEEKHHPGDESLFIDSDWDDVEAVLGVPIGIDGILPESGIVWLHGPAGHGKTILAYWILMQYARNGFHSGIYECEMGQERTKGFFQNLNAKWTWMRRIHYFRAEYPDEIIDLSMHGRALDRRLQEVDADILLYDAANPLMAAARLNENDASDVRLFVNTSMRPVAVRGGLAIVLDHDRKNGGQRGSTDKPASGDIIIGVKSNSRFSKGQSGTITLTCDKDRNGTIETGAILEIEVECDKNDETIAFKIGKWSSISGDIKQAVSDAKTQAKIVSIIKDNGPMTAKEISDEIGLGYEATRSALRRGASNNELVRNENKTWDIPG
jgi:hypothetical protein